MEKDMETLMAMEERARQIQTLMDMVIIKCCLANNGLSFNQIDGIYRDLTGLYDSIIVNEYYILGFDSFGEYILGRYGYDEAFSVIKYVDTLSNCFNLGKDFIRKFHNSRNGYEPLAVITDGASLKVALNRIRKAIMECINYYRSLNGYKGDDRIIVRFSTLKKFLKPPLIKGGLP